MYVSYCLNSMKDQIRKQLLEQIGVSQPIPFQPKPKRKTESGLPEECILVVDDEPSCLELVSTVLEENVYNSITASSAEEGRNLLQRHSGISMIITDLKMPQEDGFTLLKFVRDNLRFNKIPVIVLTCCADRNIVMQAIEQGADDFIMKPFTPEVLLTRIERVFGRTKKNILIVTDNAVSASILERTLAGNDYRAFVAANGHQAKEIISRETIDMSLCELVLEDMTGFDLMTTAHECYYFVPFLFLADGNILLSSEDIKSVGGFGLINKPFINSEVLLEVEKCLTRSRR
ncbi:hypothetical protein TRIP_C20020 [Candidatus Zixiibacteriota bacterium]|nr:hypothetical protein TRIP_C20020 [candidate division Zixibacteria bacterium]